MRRALSDPLLENMANRRLCLDTHRYPEVFLEALSGGLKTASFCG